MGKLQLAERRMSSEKRRPLAVGALQSSTPRGNLQRIRRKVLFCGAWVEQKKGIAGIPFFCVLAARGKSPALLV
jgi:hypothetical protein